MSKKLTGTEGEIEGRDYVVCQICKKRFGQITVSHLKFHNITMKEYKELYPNIKLQCENTKNKRWNYTKENEISDGKVECLICHKYYNKLGGNHLKSHGLTLDEYLKMFPGAQVISEGAINNYSESKIGDKHPLNAPKNREKNREILRLARKQFYIDHPEAREETGKRTTQYYIDHPEAREVAREKAIKQWSSQLARDDMSRIKLQYYIDNPKLIEFFSLIRKGKYTGKNNIMAREDIKLIHKQAMEEKCSGENNPSKRLDVRIQISCTLQGIDIEDWDHFIWEENDWRDWSKAVYLNDWFKGCHRHHITETLVICIPSELHIHIPHNLKTGKGMAEMNMIALQYMHGCYND